MRVQVLTVVMHDDELGQRLIDAERVQDLAHRSQPEEVWGLRPPPAVLWPLRRLPGLVVKRKADCEMDINAVRTAPLLDTDVDVFEKLV